MQCPNCNMNIRDDATICMYCGASLQQGVNPVQQPVQNNVVQGTNVQPVVTPQAPATSQPSASVIEYKKREKRKKILLLLLIPIIAAGIYFGTPIVKEQLEKKVKEQEEFEEEDNEDFQLAAILAAETIAGDSPNSFDSLNINEKGKCDISELLGNTTQTLHQLKAK